MTPGLMLQVAAVGASQTVSGGVFAVYALTVFVSSPVFAKLVSLYHSFSSQCFVGLDTNTVRCGTVISL